MAEDMQDLAPDICRQRLVIEGIPAEVITAEAIEDYLRRLAKVLDMKPLNEPVTHNCEQFGWAGWCHWETSGTHFYVWERPRLFFSSDIYTCKPFEVKDAVNFTQDFFRVEAGNIVSHELASNATKFNRV